MYTIELRIEGSALPLDRVTEILGIKPGLTREAGSKIGSRYFDKSLWSYDGSDAVGGKNGEWDSLEEGLSFLMSLLAGVRGEFFGELSSFDIYWWCGSFNESANGSVVFSAAFLKRLGDFGIPLYFDYYFSDI